MKSIHRLFKALLLLSFLSMFIFESQQVKAQFVAGADVSWLSQMEDSGYVFKDNSGIEKNCLQILKEKGINALRYRVWVNPKQGFNGKKYVADETRIADSMGFKIMLDFHLSDTWADPGHQTKPVAWANHSFSQLQTDVYNHVYDMLDTLKSIGVTPTWVQIGNETDDGMLWPDGRASTHMDNFAKLITSGYNATKAVDSTIQVIVHISDAHDNAKFRFILDGLRNNGAKYDIIGMSSYPYWAKLSWQVNNSLTIRTMKDVMSRYNKKVMICEVGYQYDKPIEANHYLLDLIEKTKSAGGLGVFYWEPQSYNWMNYQMGAWDPITKQPTSAMDAFLGLKAASVKPKK